MHITTNPKKENSVFFAPSPVTESDNGLHPKSKFLADKQTNQNIMRKILFPIALVALLTANVSAATVSFAWGAVHSPSGGEFIATTSANGTFKTFCIEKNEYIGLGGTLHNYSISGGAIQGGVSGGNPDPISFGTAYIYNQFIAGTLADYSSSNVTNQTDLQDAFWMLEGEITYKANVYIAAAKSTLSVTDAQMIADGNGIYGVKAMNVTTLAGGIAQDQLIKIPVGPDNFTPVPDGGTTFAMLGMACASCGLIRRKFSFAV